MSKSIKGFVAVSLLAVMAACGTSNAGDVEEFVVVDPVPMAVTVEPAFTGKYN